MLSSNGMQYARNHIFTIRFKLNVATRSYNDTENSEVTLAKPQSASKLLMKGIRAVVWVGEESGTKRND